MAARVVSRVNLDRRSFLIGGAAALVAPAILRVAPIMPIKAYLGSAYSNLIDFVVGQYEPGGEYHVALTKFCDPTKVDVTDKFALSGWPGYYGYGGTTPAPGPLPFGEFHRFQTAQQAERFVFEHTRRTIMVNVHAGSACRWVAAPGAELMIREKPVRPAWRIA